MSTAVLDTKARTYSLPGLEVRLVRDRTVDRPTRKISKAADAADIVREYLDGADREKFVVILLNTKHNVIGINTVSVGGLAVAPVHPREVFKPAILVGAAAVIVAHNHPSGDPEPSMDDRVLTDTLRSAGRILGIEVLDHVIIGDDGRFVSLHDRREGGF
jgi:DNA repair protein RadC